MLDGIAAGSDYARDTFVTKSRNSGAVKFFGVLPLLDVLKMTIAFFGV